jgi:hypothetical protein
MSWPGLALEYALAWLRHQDDYIEHLDAVLAAGRAAPVPPFSVELLTSVVAAMDRYRDHRYIGRVACQVAILARELRERARPAAPHVQRLLHQLLRPSGNASMVVFEDSAIAACKELRLRWDVRAAISNADRQSWAARRTLPFRTVRGDWITAVSTAQDRADHMEASWLRWRDAVDAVPAAAPFREVLLDGLRRMLGWHLLVLAGHHRVAVPLLVFAGFAPDTGPAPAVEWVGRGDRIVVADSFRNQLQLAAQLGIDTWLARNRAGMGYASGSIPIDALYRGRLVIDATLMAETLAQLGLVLRLEEESAGLPIGIGVIGLLAGTTVDPTVWATGALRRRHDVLDRYGRRHADGALLYSDGVAGWPRRRDRRLARSLADKFGLARAHGVAREVVLPFHGAQDAIETFQQLAEREIARERHTQGAPRRGAALSVSRVHRLSVAADAALPISPRKFRAVLAPDILWAFAHGDRHGAGAYDPLAPERRDSHAALLDRLKQHRVAVVCGPRLSGKSYAIGQAMVTARRRLHDQRHTGVPIAFVRWPRYLSLVEEAWRMVLQSLSFPEGAIEDFLEATSAADQAETFVEAFRKYGPAILILSGLDERFRIDEAAAVSSAYPPQQRVFEAIARRMAEVPVVRHAVERSVLGSLELIVESNHLALPGVDPIAVEAITWDSGAAWSAVHAAVGGDALRLLGALALPEAAISGRGRWIAGTSIGLDEQSLDAATRALTDTVLVHANGFALIRDGRPPDGAIVTGPLLREAHGAFHVHPLVRDAAAAWFTAAHPVLDVVKLHRRYATEDFAPFLAPGHHHGLAPLLSLYPERLLQAHEQLARGDALLEAVVERQRDEAVRAGAPPPRGQPGHGRERATLETARLELALHYHDPHHGVAHLLHNLKRPSTVAGNSGHNRRRLAFRVLREFLDRRGTDAHPERWLLLVVVAGRLADGDLIDPREPDHRVVRLGAVLDGFLGADLAADRLQAADRAKFRQKVDAWCASWILGLFAHGHADGFPFSRDIPARFADPEVAAATFDGTLRDLSDDALRILPKEVFCHAGDWAASQGDAQRAMRWYHQGAMHMHEDSIYANLLVRAVAFAHACPIVDADVASQLTWLHPHYRRYTAGFRARRSAIVDPVVPYALHIGDRALQVPDPAAAVTTPAVWERCLRSR